LQSHSSSCTETQLATTHQAPTISKNDTAGDASEASLPPIPVATADSADKQQQQQQQKQSKKKKEVGAVAEEEVGMVVAEEVEVVVVEVLRNKRHVSQTKAIVAVRPSLPLRRARVLLLLLLQSPHQLQTTDQKSGRPETKRVVVLVLAVEEVAVVVVAIEVPGKIQLPLLKRLLLLLMMMVVLAMKRETLEKSPAPRQMTAREVVESTDLKRSRRIKIHDKNNLQIKMAAKGMATKSIQARTTMVLPKTTITTKALVIHLSKKLLALFQTTVMFTWMHLQRHLHHPCLLLFNLKIPVLVARTTTPRKREKVVVQRARMQ
jgi:hypothetical protein